jgi:hypothetical protein
MTTRPLSFIGRLAPAAATTACAVRAALPARFASADTMRPIDEFAEVPANPAIEPPRTEAAVPVRTERAADVSAAMQSASPALGAGQHKVIEPSDFPEPPPQAEREPVVSDTSRAPVAPRRQASPPKSSTSGPDYQRVAGTERPLPIAAPAAASEPRGPLQPATVMERALAARRAEPDVVQLTIDRIDIRLPPESGRPAVRPEPRRRPGPATSLSDYLRRDDPASRSRG